MPEVGMFVRIEILASCAFVAMLAVVSCSESPQSDHQTDVPATPPRFPTLDSLVRHLNGLSEGGELTAYSEYYSLIFEENDLQRAFAQYYEQFVIPAIEFELLLCKRFGLEYGPTLIDSFVIAGHPIRITQQDAERARGLWRDVTGDDVELHFVKISGNWWISGYTTEYRAGIDEAKVGENVRITEGLAPVLRAVTERLRNGEFSTSQEAVEAFATAGKAHLEERSDGTGRDE
jgi:hypothetical protein